MRLLGQLFDLIIPVYLPEDIEIFDAMRNTWIDTHVNLYPEKASVIVNIDGAHRLEASQAYVARGYGTVMIDHHPYLFKHYNTHSAFSNETVEIIDELAKTGYKTFYRLRVKNFNTYGRLIDFTEWRIWLDNKEQVSAITNWLRGITY